jgi:signal transduction histidine kinase
LQERLAGIESDVQNTLESARGEANPSGWADAKAGIEVFLRQARQSVENSRFRTGSPEALAGLLQAHQAMEKGIGRLVEANYQSAVAQEASGSREHEANLRRALTLLGIGLALALACAAITVRAIGRIFHRMAWQARELSRLSRHVLETQEQMLQRFARELHDEFGQSLTAIEANLAAVPSDSPAVAEHVEDCTLLVKDLMANVRDLSQLLRPSTLDDFGLKPSLQALVDSFAQRTGIDVKAEFEFEDRLHGETEIHLYRIAQEALTNVARHSGARHARVTLTKRDGRVRLTIADDGIGIHRKAAHRGFGLAGMRERMRIAGGTLELKTDGAGVAVIAEVALDEASQHAEADPSPVSG